MHDPVVEDIHSVCIGGPIGLDGFSREHKGVTLSINAAPKRPIVHCRGGIVLDIRHQAGRFGLISQFCNRLSMTSSKLHKTCLHGTTVWTTGGGDV